MEYATTARWFIDRESPTKMHLADKGVTLCGKELETPTRATVRHLKFNGKCKQCADKNVVFKPLGDV